MHSEWGGVIHVLDVLGNPVSNGIVRNVSIQQGFGMHELAFVSIEYIRPYTSMKFLKLWEADTPLAITYGRLPNNITVFNGYVNHVEVNSSSNSGNQNVEITYVLIGTSGPMNQDQTRVWHSLSYSYAAKKIAQEYGLRAVVHKCPSLTPSEAQAGESDFTFLQRLASKSGFRFWVSGSTLYFVDPNIMLTTKIKSSVPIFRTDKGLTKMDSITNFEITSGSNLPGRVKGKRIVTGLDSRTGRVIKATAGTGTDIQVQTTATNYAQASAIAKGALYREQNWITATATLYGRAVITPNTVVYLTGSALPLDQEGYWLVSGTNHRLSNSLVRDINDIYYTDVDLIRNTEVGVQSVDVQAVGDIPPGCFLNLDTKQWKSAISTAVEL